MAAAASALVIIVLSTLERVSLDARSTEFLVLRFVFVRLCLVQTLLDKIEKNYSLS